MFNPGYVVVDGTGINLNVATKQTISGFYAKAKEAFDTGKPVFVANCNMSGAPCTPVSVIAWMEGTDIIATGHVLRVVIGSDNGVTVTNLVAG